MLLAMTRVLGAPARTWRARSAVRSMCAAESPTRFTGMLATLSERGHTAPCKVRTLLEVLQWRPGWAVVRACAVATGVDHPTGLMRPCRGSNAGERNGHHGARLNIIVPRIGHAAGFSTVAM